MCSYCGIRRTHTTSPAKDFQNVMRRSLEAFMREKYHLPTYALRELGSVQEPDF